MRKYDLRKRLSAVFIVPLLLSSCGSAGGGGGTAETDSREITEYSLLGKDISDGVSMKSGQCLLTVEPYDGGYRVRIKSGDTVMFSSDTPVSLMIRAAGRNTEKEYAVCYEKLEGDGRTLTATATVETVAESLIRVTDRYYGDGELVTLERTVKTERASGSDEGFSSRVMFEYVGGTPSFDCMDWFVPGVWNKDPVMDSPEGVASSYGVSAITVKDTRTGLPMVTARGKDTGCHPLGRQDKPGDIVRHIGFPGKEPHHRRKLPLRLCRRGDKKKLRHGRHLLLLSRIGGALRLFL